LPSQFYELSGRQVCKKSASGASHVGSDLDIVVIGKESLDWKVMAKLRGEFEESNLPFSVDVLDWNALPENFKDTITRNFEVVQDSGFDTATGSGHSATAQINI
jgi:hypothetical protein